LRLLLAPCLLKILPSESQFESMADDALDRERLRLDIVLGGVGSDATERDDGERFGRMDAGGSTTGCESKVGLLDMTKKR
jgi:hypothetical protein